jgi:hypothetical protein
MEETRDSIMEDIHKNFWSEELRAFVQYRGSNSLDAAVLLMPLVRFISPMDPRWLSTLGMKEMPAATSHLPNAFVLSVPVFRKPLQRSLMAIPVIDIHRHIYSTDKWHSVNSPHMSNWSCFDAALPTRGVIRDFRLGERGMEADHTTVWRWGVSRRRESAVLYER